MPNQFKYSAIARGCRICSIPLVLLASQSFAADDALVQLIKRNAQDYAIDGNNGGANGQDVYLWSENESNENQQWYEIDRGDGYYSYQKFDTDYCLDGNNGGDDAQNVYLWTCSDNNYNQHWLKVDVGDGYYRLEKRNASGYSLDGNKSGEDGQSVYLWSSNDNNQNQHWYFNYLTEVETESSECELPWSGSDISISNETLSTTTDAIDIACADEVSISMTIEGDGPMESADYLDIYYSVDGGDYQTLVSQTNAFDQTSVSVSGISGSTLEILVEGKTSYGDETYTVTEMSVVEGEVTVDDNDDSDDGEQAVSADVNCSGAYDLEACIEAMADSGGGTVVLDSKTYYLTDSIQLESNVNIQGQGSSTLITWDDSIASSIDAPLLTRTSGNLENVSISDLMMNCQVDTSDTDDQDRTDTRGLYIVGGGSQLEPDELDHSNITMERVEITQCGGEAIQVKGTNGFTGIDLNFYDNGWGYTDLWHNIYLKRVHNVVIKQTDAASGGFKDSPAGHGMRMSDLDDVYLEGLVVTGNADHGIHMDDCSNMRGYDLTIEGNCADANGTCNAYKCYGDCDVDFNADQE